jgi:hypothetical protein
MLKSIALIICFVLLIVVIIAVQNWIVSQDHLEINSWAQKHNYIVKNIERRLVSIGPFWYTDKHSRVYKVDMENVKTVWFRFSPFATDVIEE